jgi:hypothetical protein
MVSTTIGVSGWCGSTGAGLVQADIPTTIARIRLTGLYFIFFLFSFINEQAMLYKDKVA